MGSLLQGFAFVTGAASGIGQATASSLAQYGIAKLALADINLERLETVAASLREQWPHVEVLALKMDVGSSAEVKAGLAEATVRFGRLDVAVNNAGISGQNARLHELDEEDWQRVIDINLHGVFRCQKEELAIMVNQEDLGLRRGRGVIINVASMYGLIGPRGPIRQTAYSAAKHAVVGITKADAHSYAGSNIRINAICPGYIETPIVSGSLDNLDQPSNKLHDYVVHTPLGRLGKPEEVADSIVFLASPLSSYVNGTGLVVDGGFSSG